MIARTFSVNSNEILHFSIKHRYGKEFAEKAMTPIHWGLVLVKLIADALLDSIHISNPGNMAIYNKISSEPNYWTVFQGFDGEISMEDIINRVNQD